MLLPRLLLGEAYITHGAWPPLQHLRTQHLLGVLTEPDQDPGAPNREGAGLNVKTL